MENLRYSQKKFNHNYFHVSSSQFLKPLVKKKALKISEQMLGMGATDGKYCKNLTSREAILLLASFKLIYLESDFLYVVYLTVVNLVQLRIPVCC